MPKRWRGLLVERPRKKQKSSGGKRQILVAETATENANSIVRKPPLLGSVRIPPLLLYLGGEGVADRPAREGVADRPAVLCSDVGRSFRAGTRVGEGRRKNFGENFDKKRREPRASTSFLECGLKSPESCPRNQKTGRYEHQIRFRHKLTWQIRQVAAVSRKIRAAIPAVGRASSQA